MTEETQGPEPSPGVPSPQDAKEQLEQALFEIRRIIAGQDEMLERVARMPAGARPSADRGRSRPREDADDQDDGRRARRLVRPGAVHARPRPVRPRRNADLPRRRRLVRHRARPRLLQLPARRRDQPCSGEGAVGTPRGHAGAPGHHRSRDASRARPVPRDGHPEPDRVRGHVSAAGGRRSTGSCSRSSSATRSTTRSSRSSIVSSWLIPSYVRRSPSTT